MPTLDIALEMHVPGLGTSKLRHLQHRIALELLGTHALHLGARAWQEFRRSGRGLLIVDPERWLHLAAERSGQGREVPDPPAEYVAAEAVAEALGTATAHAPARLLTETYDPQRTFVLGVRHPEGAFSVLLLRLAAPAGRGEPRAAQPFPSDPGPAIDDEGYRHRPVVLPRSSDDEPPRPVLHRAGESPLARRERSSEPIPHAAAEEGAAAAIDGCRGRRQRLGRP